jgi:hypothetical protein
MGMKFKKFRFFNFFTSNANGQIRIQTVIFEVKRTNQNAPRPYSSAAPTAAASAGGDARTAPMQVVPSPPLD